VALKLFTAIEKFEIMAIPFFILAGKFPHPCGVARRMIDFATSLIGHWHGGLALARHLRLRDVCAGVRIERRDPWWRSDRSSCRDGLGRLSDALRRGVITVAASLGI